MTLIAHCGEDWDLDIIRPFARSAVSTYGCGRFSDLCSPSDRLHGATMATCPECEFDEIDTTDQEEGDELSCPECGKMLVVGGSDDLVIAGDDDDDDDEDDDDDLDEDDDEDDDGEVIEDDEDEGLIEDELEEEDE